MKKSSCLKPQGLDIWYEASPIGPQPRLFKLCSWGQKLPQPQGSNVLHRLIYGKHEKIWSEATRPRALIFGMKHHLVDLYQVCSNIPLRLKMGPPLWTQTYAPKEIWIAYNNHTVRQSVRLRVRCISLILFEVGIPNLV